MSRNGRTETLGVRGWSHNEKYKKPYRARSNKRTISYHNTAEEAHEAYLKYLCAHPPQRGRAVAIYEAVKNKYPQLKPDMKARVYVVTARILCIRDADDTDPAEWPWQVLTDRVIGSGDGRVLDVRSEEIYEAS